MRRGRGECVKPLRSLPLPGEICLVLSCAEPLRSLPHSFKLELERIHVAMFNVKVRSSRLDLVYPTRGRVYSSSIAVGMDSLMKET